VIVGVGVDTGTLRVEVDGSATIAVSSWDAGTMSLAATVEPEAGTLGVNTAAGVITYTPDPGYQGTDAFAYWVCTSTSYSGPDEIIYSVTDSAGVTDTCVLQIQVVRSPDGPSDPCSERVILSEVAWAGTAANPAHEWVELQNLENEPVDLTGWTLRWRRRRPATEEESLWKAIGLVGTVGAFVGTEPLGFVPLGAMPGGYLVEWNGGERGGDRFLIERATDDVVADTTADLLYGDRLSLDRIHDLADEGEIVELLDPYGCVVDTANTDSPERDGWAAGDAATRSTMERTDPLSPDVDPNWHTNLGLFVRGVDAAGEPLFATAGGRNSPPVAGMWAVPPGPELSPEKAVPLLVSRMPRQTIITRPGDADPRTVPLVAWLGRELYSDSPSHVWLRFMTGEVWFVPVEAPN